MKDTVLPWDITRILFAVVAIGGLIAASFWVLKPFLPAVIWAVMIVVATWPEMRWVERRLGGRRSFAVAVMTAAMVAIILGPIALAVTALIDRADEIAGWTKSLTHLSVPQAPSWVRDVPLVGARITTWWNGIASTPPQELAANITPHLAVIGGWLLGQAGSFVALFVQLLLTLAISAVLYAKGEGAAEWVLAFARRLAGVDGERAARLSGQA